jgi:GntR family transcriptional regulator
MVRYTGIADDLRAKLRSLELPEDCALPTEAEFCNLYNASRTTIRAALDVLEKQGLVHRRQGKGTFYRPNGIVKDLGSIVDFHTEADSAGRKSRTSVVSLVTRRPSAAEYALFGDRETREGLVELRRLRFIDDEPAVLQTSYLAHASLGVIAPEDLSNTSLYRFLKEHRGIVIASLDETLEPDNVGAVESEYLEIPEGTAVFRSHRVARDAEGRVIEASDNFIRGDIYRFRVRRATPQDLS